MSSQLDRDCSDAPRFEFRVDDARLTTNLVIAAALSVVGLGLFPVGVFCSFPEPALNMRLATIALGAIWISLTLALFFGTWTKLGQRVLVFSDRFVFHKPGFDVVCKWDDIAAIWRNSSTFGSAAMTATDLSIQMKDGRKLFLAQFFIRMESLVDVILSETSRLMIPNVLAKVRNGQTVEFGNLEINSTTLRYRENDLPWHEVQAIEVAHGEIVIRRKAEGWTWYRTAVKKMPNYHVFLAVAAALRQSSDAAGRRSDKT